jgi:hypothetical protein
VLGRMNCPILLGSIKSSLCCRTLRSGGRASAPNARGYWALIRQRSVLLRILPLGKRSRILQPGRGTSNCSALAVTGVQGIGLVGRTVLQVTIVRERQLGFYPPTIELPCRASELVDYRVPDFLRTVNLFQDFYYDQVLDLW